LCLASDRQHRTKEKQKNDTEGDMESIVYFRERKRTKPLSILKKLIYGIGELPFGLLNGVTGTFLMLYYVQIIGVSASSIGLLLGLAFLVDALTDPILAEFSGPANWCIGCGRTRDECHLWDAPKPYARNKLLAQLKKRMLKMRDI
jgi:hypothetical protein